MSPLILLLFLLTIFTGTGIVLISSNWFFVWLGLEINTLAFLPLLITTHHPRATEATTKYFLIQALASALLLFSGLLQASWLNSWDINSPLLPVTTTLLIIAVALKMAIAPCHSWLPDVLQGLPFRIGLILSTWQKIAPFYILLILPPQPIWLYISLGLLSATLGGWGGLNQTHIRKLLAYSSIAHLGWIITIFPWTPQLSVLSLLLYFVITGTLFITLHFLNTFNLADLSNIINFAPWLTTLTLFTTLSLGGLPPLTGFLSKWLILQELSLNSSFFTATVLIGASLISLFFYLRITYIILLSLSPQHTATSITWRASQNAQLTNIPLATLICISTIGLIVPPTWLALTF
uniref:NADH-ubiquinone oxidoreductase chain 2 n=1 Tax=Glossobalanus marginatus TaxID=1443200 RepID=A0A3Q8HFJ2_9BILA|nr:NADH dehydrogenase subunit 2 [Glossobalanus marginatus]AXZ97161.1 NADH dehydrogenase subunit 2 [Glossobalanus marginatus]